MEIYDLLGRLEKVRGKSPQWKACCPAHDDKKPSLSIKLLDDGRILINCFAGCGASDIMQAVSLSLTDLSPNGKLGHYLPGKTRKFREPESVYGNLGAVNLARSLRQKDAEIERLKKELRGT